MNHQLQKFNTKTTRLAALSIGLALALVLLYQFNVINLPAKTSQDQTAKETAKNLETDSLSNDYSYVIQPGDGVTPGARRVDHGAGRKDSGAARGLDRGGELQRRRRHVFTG